MTTVGRVCRRIFEFIETEEGGRKLLELISMRFLGQAPSPWTLVSNSSSSTFFLFVANLSKSSAINSVQAHTVTFKPVQRLIRASIILLPWDGPPSLQAVRKRISNLSENPRWMQCMIIMLSHPSFKMPPPIQFSFQSKSANCGQRTRDASPQQRAVRGLAQHHPLPPIGLQRNHLIHRLLRPIQVSRVLVDHAAIASNGMGVA